MHGDRALNETQKFELPSDLVQELQRRGAAPQVDMHMDHWKPSFFSRLVGMFSGKRSR